MIGFVLWGMECSCALSDDSVCLANHIIILFLHLGGGTPQLDHKVALEHSRYHPRR